MKKRIIFIVIALFAFVLASCGYVEDVPGNVTHTLPGESETESNDKPTGSNSDPTSDEFTATLKWNGVNFPLDDEVIYCIWTSRTKTVKAKFNNDGVAKTTGLDGEFEIHLSGTPEGYTYNPNGIIVSNDNPNANIELMYYSPYKGKGTDFYDDVCRITNITIKDKDNVGKSYAYKVEIKNSKSLVYCEFEPKNQGIYTVESLCDVVDDTVNPYVDLYNGTHSAKFFNKTVDDGGYSKKGGYTKNFKCEMSFSDEHIGNVFAFAIHAESKTGEYPVTVTFIITYESFYETDKTPKPFAFAKEVYAQRDSSGNIIYDTLADGSKEIRLNYVLDTDKKNEYFKTTYLETDPYSGTNSHGIGQINTDLTGCAYIKDQYKYRRIRYSKTSDGKYYEDQDGDYVLMGTINTPSMSGTYVDFANYSEFRKTGRTIFDGNVIVYNEVDGYYHLNTIDGPIVCAKLTVKTAYTDLSINHIEDPGNSMLKLFGEINYKRFLEAEYCDMTNSNGVCYVNKELKNFLQDLSNSGAYFFDGKGYCEADGTFAAEEDQWMFACGFYQN